MCSSQRDTPPTSHRRRGSSAQVGRVSLPKVVVERNLQGRERPAKKWRVKRREDVHFRLAMTSAESAAVVDTENDMSSDKTKNKPRIRMTSGFSARAEEEGFEPSSDLTARNGLSRPPHFDGSVTSSARLDRCSKVRPRPGGNGTENPLEKLKRGATSRSVRQESAARRGPYVASCSRALSLSKKLLQIQWAGQGSNLRPWD